MREKFDFTKIEDQKKFDALPKKERDKISDEAQEEAEKMKRYVDRGISKDYNEAEREIDEDNKIEEIINKLKEKFKISRMAPQLRDQLEEMSEKFGGLDNVRGKRIIDLGCGAVSGTFETDNFNYMDRKEGREPKRTFEPWLCRALVELGANPVGVDIGNLEGEEFEHYRIDLSKSGALEFLPSKSFDGVNLRLFLTSPHLEAMTSQKKREEIKGEMERQTKRLLKDDGKIIEFDTEI